MASLYPYKPIGNTVYAAGQPARVNWIDDGRVPKLAKIGPLRIDLFAEFDVCHISRFMYRRISLLTFYRQEISYHSRSGSEPAQPVEAS